ncbi:uncharacterized protein V1510DRAFT_414134 [Dipodascopsis tothii]|uniref:uncharacterized protein n=1 Tax=Dipodascopsis tothii TaxID=44089 RepID=UPI0034CD467A
MSSNKPGGFGKMGGAFGRREARPGGARAAAAPYARPANASGPALGAHAASTANMSIEAAIAQQQSVYVPGAPAPALGARAGPSKAKTDKRVTVVREGGGKKWEDPTLLEWDPTHFRLFVGNLGGEVTDDTVLRAFSKYPSVSKARVIRDRKTAKSKGYGFVAFRNSDDYFRAFKDMNGSYIGSHPVLLRKAQTEIKTKTVTGSKPYHKAVNPLLAAQEKKYRKR